MHSDRWARLLVCFALGAMLCALSVAYVFALKNNRPAHYDTDFFESILIESGALALAFGPNDKRPPNPFRSESIAAESGRVARTDQSVTGTRSTRPAMSSN